MCCVCLCDAELLSFPTDVAVHRCFYCTGRMVEAPRTPGLCVAEAASSAAPRNGPRDLVLPLVIGKPPADSSPIAALLVALQELYEDLHEFMRLRWSGGEQSCLLLEDIAEQFQEPQKTCFSPVHLIMTHRLLGPQ